MNKIKVLIAIPIYKRELLVLNSIKSIIDSTIVNDQMSITIAFGINEIDDDIKEILNTYKSDKFNIKVYDFGENIGKSRAVNRIAYNEKYDFHYIVSIDSDMICIDPYWLIKMLTVYMNYNKDPILNTKKGSLKLGSLCCNQIGNNVHLCHLHDKKITVNIGKYSIITAPNNYGVAGGVLMSDINTWKQLKGYKATKLYGTDDGHYNYDCAVNNKLAGFLNEVSFFHPYEIDETYKQWKHTVINGQDEYDMNTIYYNKNNKNANRFIRKLMNTGINIKIRESNIMSECQYIDDNNIIYNNSEVYEKFNNIITNINPIEPIGNIHILWATNRPDMFKATHKQWMNNALYKHKITTTVAIDNDLISGELSDYRVMITNNDIPGVCFPCYCLSKNLDANDNDIVVFASDDFFPPKHWDAFIADQLNESDKLLVVNDGIQKYPNKVVTIPIMTYSALKKMNKIIYHPVYHHMHSDVELYTTAEKLGLIKDIRHISNIEFTHHHYVNNHRKFDDSDNKLVATYKPDELLYKRRKSLNINQLLYVDNNVINKANNIKIIEPKVDLSILVCTTTERKHYLDRFLESINKQLNNKVELLIECDDGSMKIGHKRNVLLDKSKGKYICYFDDDDLPSDDYIELILNAIKSNSDCCSLEGIYTINGENPTLFRHSLDYKQWETANENGKTVYYRCPNHLNAVKRDIALKVRFDDNKSNGEDKDYSERLLPYLNTEEKITQPIYNYLYQTIKKGY